MIRFGVDLGGTKIELVALDVAGQVLWQQRVATPVGDYDGTVRAIAQLVTQAECELKQTGTVGIGTPGAISRATGLLKNSNSVCLNGKPLDRDLAIALQRPVRIANDANCFALSEATDGAGSGCEVVFGVIIGTGTGGGVVVRGHVLTGCNSIAGEWGHNPLPWPRAEELPGSACYCGQHGCIETFLSGPGLSNDFSRATGQSLSAKDIAARAMSGDPAANVCLQRYADRLARALASIINVLDPDAIVLGGGMSNVSALYEMVPQLWTRYVFSDAVQTSLLPAKFGDASGVRGAAWLWND